MWTVTKSHWKSCFVSCSISRFNQFERLHALAFKLVVSNHSTDSNSTYLNQLTLIRNSVGRRVSKQSDVHCNIVIVSWNKSDAVQLTIQLNPPIIRIVNALYGKKSTSRRQSNEMCASLDLFWITFRTLKTNPRWAHTGQAGPDSGRLILVEFSWPRLIQYIRNLSGRLTAIAGDLRWLKLKDSLI